ncbi:putative AMP-binding enzyme [Fonsecaea pedrosoi]|nr:putative AMP-binding enzyme [Fonsecaea pedrosoi]
MSSNDAGQACLPVNLELPGSLLFIQLLNHATQAVATPLIKDLTEGIQRSAIQLLSDVVHLRQVIRAALPPAALQQLQDGLPLYLTIVAPGGYQFVVAFLAVLSLGAVASPISHLCPLKEACYYVQKAGSRAVIAATTSLKQAQALAHETSKTTDPSFTCIPVQQGLGLQEFHWSQFTVENRFRDPNAPGLVIFTSGTTGPPKAAVIRVGSLDQGTITLADQLKVTRSDSMLHVLPVHHATGIWISLLPFLLRGACVHFKSGTFDSQWTWDYFKQRKVTHFSGVPTIYMRMMHHYQACLAKLPGGERDQYTASTAQMKACLCGTSALPRPVEEFWMSMLGGKRIVQRYGSTEAGMVLTMPCDPLEQREIPLGSVGYAAPGVDVKLSEGTTGEIRVKSYNAFLGFLNDPESTAKAHDPDGYFVSGDLAQRCGNYFSILGRASVDILKSGGYKVSALDIEREILSLPYIKEVSVVGVPDDEFGQRIGAVVQMRSDQGIENLKLDDLRADLRKNLAGYKLPTLLRVIETELPKSVTNKVVKKTLGPLYFPENYRSIPEVQVWKHTSKL